MANVSNTPGQVPENTVHMERVQVSPEDCVRAQTRSKTDRLLDSCRNAV